MVQCEGGGFRPVPDVDLGVDIGDMALHRALATTCLLADDAACALREYEMLTGIEPDNASHFEAAALAAKNLGRNERAIELAKRAVALDPSSSVLVIGTEGATDRERYDAIIGGEPPATG